MDATIRRLTAEFAREHGCAELDGYVHANDVRVVDLLNAYIEARIGPRILEWRPIEGTFLL